MRPLKLLVLVVTDFVVAGPVRTLQAVTDDRTACRDASGGEAIDACARVIQNREASTQRRLSPTDFRAVRERLYHLT
jgi:hypothetical protein